MTYKGRKFRQAILGKMSDEFCVIAAKETRIPELNDNPSTNCG